MCLFTKKRKISNNCGKEGFLKRAYIRSTFLAGILHKKHLVNIELLTSVKDWCFWIANKKTTKLEENLLGNCLFFRLGSFHRLQGGEKNTQKLAINFVPKDFQGFFLFSSSFLVFGLGSFHRLQSWTKNKKEPRRKLIKTKKQSLGRNFLPKDFLHRIVVFVFFGFLVFGLGNFQRLQRWEKTKKIEENQKTKTTKSWEKCCAQGFPPGFNPRWMFLFLGFFAFCFLRVFLVVGLGSFHWL